MDNNDQEVIDRMDKMFKQKIKLVDRIGKWTLIIVMLICTTVIVSTFASH